MVSRVLETLLSGLGGTSVSSCITRTQGKKARGIEFENLCINSISITLTNAEGYAVTLYLEVVFYLRHVTACFSGASNYIIDNRFISNPGSAAWRRQQPCLITCALVHSPLSFNLAAKPLRPLDPLSGSIEKLGS